MFDQGKVTEKSRCLREVRDSRRKCLCDHRELEDQGIRPYLPLLDFGGRTASFDKLAFPYDAAQDRYLCPQSTPLPFDRLLKPQRVLVYRADAATRSACPLKDRCTESMHGRTVSRSYDKDYVERVRVYHQTEACQKARLKRQIWVEPLFAEAKAWRGLRRFRLRRLWRVNSEALLIAAGQNLKRLLSWQGWGRRPWPGGAPGLALHASTSHGPRVLRVYVLILPAVGGLEPTIAPMACGGRVPAA